MAWTVAASKLASILPVSALAVFAALGATDLSQPDLHLVSEHEGVELDRLPP